MGSSGFLANSKIYGGLHWATVTHGTRMSNFSISGGYGYIDFGDFMEYSDPRYTYDYPGAIHLIISSMTITSTLTCMVLQTQLANKEVLEKLDFKER